jgi:hypothetical protein
MIRKILKSESFIDDVFSLFLSLFRFKYGFTFVKSMKVYYRKQGTLVINDGRLFFGFLSNRVSLSPNNRGVLRIYKNGLVRINGSVRIARDVKLYSAG